MFTSCLPTLSSKGARANEEVIRKTTPAVIRNDLLANQLDKKMAPNGVVGPWTNDPLKTVYDSYTLKERLVMYARDLRSLHRSVVKASICDDPVLLPEEYFTIEERCVVLRTEEEGRTYQRIIEELLLDKRGHFTTNTDVLPIVQRVFAITCTDLDSDMVARRQVAFHKDYRKATRIMASRMPFGEHSF